MFRASLKFTGNIHRLRLRPGDVVVFEVPDGTRPQDVELIQAAVKERFPDNTVMVLGGGLRVAAVLKPEEVACG